MSSVFKITKNNDFFSGWSKLKYSQSNVQSLQSLVQLGIKPPPIPLSWEVIGKIIEPTSYLQLESHIDKIFSKNPKGLQWFSFFLDSFFKSGLNFLFFIGGTGINSLLYHNSATVQNWNFTIYTVKKKTKTTNRDDMINCLFECLQSFLKRFLNYGHFTSIQLDKYGQFHVNLEINQNRISLAFPLKIYSSLKYLLGDVSCCTLKMLLGYGPHQQMDIWTTKLGLFQLFHQCVVLGHHTFKPTKQLVEMCCREFRRGEYRIILPFRPPKNGLKFTVQIPYMQLTVISNTRIQCEHFEDEMCFHKEPEVQEKICNRILTPHDSQCGAKFEVVAPLIQIFSSLCKEKKHSLTFSGFEQQTGFYRCGSPLCDKARVKTFLEKVKSKFLSTQVSLSTLVDFNELLNFLNDERRYLFDPTTTFKEVVTGIQNLNVMNYTYVGSPISFLNKTWSDITEHWTNIYFSHASLTLSISQDEDLFQWPKTFIDQLEEKDIKSELIMPSWILPCCLCFQSVSPKKKNFVRLACGHVFHALSSSSCGGIEKWMEQVFEDSFGISVQRSFFTCPTCRQEIKIKTSMTEIE